MAKNMYIDGSWVIMHFNSSRQSYFEIIKFGPFVIECYNCHQSLPFEMSLNIGEDQYKTCPHCLNKVDYKTIFLTEDLAKLFDVRGRTEDGRPLVTGGIMHIGLPVDHPEFDKLIENNENRISQPSPDFRLIEYTCAVINSAKDIFIKKGEEIPRRKSYDKERICYK